MNLFNCFQAMAFYTMTPFLIQWLFQNNYNTWGYISSVGLFAGYCLLSFTIHDNKR